MVHHNLLHKLTKIWIHLTYFHVIDIQTVYQQCVVALYTTSPLSEAILESGWWLYPVGGCLLEPAAVPDVKLLVIVFASVVLFIFTTVTKLVSLSFISFIRRGVQKV